LDLLLLKVSNTKELNDILTSDLKIYSIKTMKIVTIKKLFLATPFVKPCFPFIKKENY
jgi:hypothetical protein